MRNLLPILAREIAWLARECAKWTAIGAVFFLSLWILTDGLPRMVTVINGFMP